MPKKSVEDALLQVFFVVDQAILSQNSGVIDATWTGWSLKESAEESFSRFAREARSLSRKIKKAQTDLLQSGFDVPDHWLKIDAVHFPEKSHKETPCGWISTVTRKRVNVQPLEMVLGEINAAITVSPKDGNDCDDPEQMVSLANITRRFFLSSEQRDRMRKKLENWRTSSNASEWLEVPGRNPKRPQYLHRLGSVRQLIHELLPPLVSTHPVSSTICGIITKSLHTRSCG